MADSGHATKNKMRELNDFAVKATEYKIPRKFIKPDIKIEKYDSIILKKESTGTKIDFGLLTPSSSRIISKNFKKVDTQFTKIEKLLTNVIS